jgi:hypothetical protein
MSLDTIHPKARRLTTLTLLMYAVIGVPGLAQPGCDRLQIQDAATGMYRDATAAEKQQLVQASGQAASDVAMTIPGGAFVVPIIQALTQLGALFVAWRIRPTDSPAAPASPAAAATAPPPAAPPT